jgi:ATP-dependent RNA helicase RhlE
MNNTQVRTKRNNSFSRYGNATGPGKQRNSGKRKMQSTVDPKLLIKKAVNVDEPVFKATRSYDQMPININLKANLHKKGYKNPTQIQEKTLEHLIAGQDLLGVANTGTGKTGAFLIPIIEQLLNSQQPFKSLVVVPTRELALQVEEEFKTLAQGLGLYAACFIGGTSVGRDLSQLRRLNHVVVGTPGRLIDLYNRGALRFQDFSTLVLDEFDRMLDMGFVNDVKRISKAMVRRKQTMLFSATIDRTQKTLISELLNNPMEIKVNSGTSTSDQIEQDIIRVPQGADKFALLLNLISDKEFEKVLVFAETKRLVDKLSKKLNQSGVRAELIHGNKSQNARNNALDKFKKGNVQVLVATDVAARGIDVSNVTHVVNYQIPMSFDSYVHRIGRTGRAGKRGKAFTFVD